MSGILCVGCGISREETITSALVLEKEKPRMDQRQMTMPGMEAAGTAMPTVFAFDENGEVVLGRDALAGQQGTFGFCENFLQRPSELLEKQGDRLEQEHLDKIRQALSWQKVQDIPGLAGAEISAFRQGVTVFVNALFSHPRYAAQLAEEARGCDEIRFAVAYPDHWNRLDTAVYGLVLRGTVLGRGKYQGLPSRLLLVSESCALSAGAKKEEGQNQNTFVLRLAPNWVDAACVEDKGGKLLHTAHSARLGTQVLDRLVQNLFLEQLRQAPQEWEEYQKWGSHDQLLLECRKVRGQIGEFAAKKAFLQYGNCRPMGLSEERLKEAICQTALWDILREDRAAEGEELDLQESWTELLRKFVVESRIAMVRQGAVIDRVILAAKDGERALVLQMLARIFGSLSPENIVCCPDPGLCICRGLGYLAASCWPQL